MAVLARIERRKLDEQRGVVVAAQDEQRRLADMAGTRHAAWIEAVGLAATAEAELDLWGEVSRGTRQLLDRAEKRRQDQARDLDAAQAVLHGHLVELKRLEVLAERRAARHATALATAERRMLDELAVLRHGRDSGQT